MGAREELIFFLAATAWYWIWFSSKQNNRQTMPATILNNFAMEHGEKRALCGKGRGVAGGRGMGSVEWASGLRVGT